MTTIIINTDKYTLSVNREQNNPITKMELTQLIDWCDTVSTGFIDKINFEIENINLIGNISC